MISVKNALKRVIYKPKLNDTEEVVSITESLVSSGKWPSTLEQIRDKFGNLNAAEALVVKAVIENRPVENLGSLMCINIGRETFYVSQNDGELSTFGTKQLGFVRRDIIRWLEDGPNVIDAVRKKQDKAMRIMQEYLQAPIKIR